MLDCLKLDEGIYLVAYKDNSVKIVSPKDDAETVVLENQAELSEMNKDFSLFKEASRQIDFRDLTKIFENVITVYLNVFNIQLTQQVQLELPAAINLNTVFGLGFFYTAIAGLMDSAFRLVNLSDRLNTEKMIMSKISEQKQKINDFIKHSKKRRVEEFIYKYSDSEEKNIEQERQLLLK